MSPMKSFSHPRLYALLFLLASVLNQLSNFSQAALLKNPTLKGVYSSKLESQEIFNNGGSLKKSKSLPDLRPKGFPDELNSEILDNSFLPQDDNIKANEATPGKFALKKPESSMQPASCLSRSSQSNHPVNLLPPDANAHQSPPHPSYYHHGIAPINTQGRQAFPGNDRAQALIGLKPHRTLMAYAQPGGLYSVVEGKPSEMISPAVSITYHPHDQYPVLNTYQAPSYNTAENLYGSQPLLYHAKTFPESFEVVHPTIPPHGSTNTYGIQNPQNFFGHHQPKFHPNAEFSQVYNPRLYAGWHASESHRQIPCYDPIHLVNAPLQQTGYQVRPFHLNPYGGETLQPREFQGAIIPAAHPNNAAPTRSSHSSTFGWDILTKDFKKNPKSFVKKINRNPPPMYNVLNRGESTTASTSSQISPKSPRNNIKNHNYTKDPKEFGVVNKIKPIFDDKNQKELTDQSKNLVPEEEIDGIPRKILIGDHVISVSDKVMSSKGAEVYEPHLQGEDKKKISVQKNAEREDKLNQNSENLHVGNNDKFVLNNVKGLEVFEGHELDLKSLTSDNKGNPDFEVNKHPFYSLRDSEHKRHFSQKEDEANNYHKLELKLSSSEEFPLLTEAIKVKKQTNAIQPSKKHITNKFSLAESRKKIGRQKPYRKAYNPYFQTKYLNRNKVSDKKEDIILSDTHSKKKGDDSQRDKDSKSSMEYNNEKSLKLKGMLTIKYEQEANKNEARLETGKALMEKSGRKYQKNTLISSIDNAKVSSEKVLSSPSNFFVKSDLQKSNKQLNNYQTQHVKEKSGAEKVKGSGMLEFLEKKNPPVVEDVFFPNKQNKEVQNTQKSEKEIILASGKSSLTKTAGSQFDSVKDQEKIEQVEKKIEASHTQNPEKIILTEVKNRKQKNIATSIIAPSGKEMKINALKIPSAPKNSITKPSSSHNPINTNKKLKNIEKFSVNDAKSREDLTKEVRVGDKTFIENAINKNNEDLMIREKPKKLELDASDMKEKLNVNENLKKSENEIKNQKEISKSRNASNLLKFEEPNSSSSNKPPNEFKDLAEKRANPISDGAPKVSTESLPGAIIKSPENNIESALPSSGNTLEKSDRAKQDKEKTPIFSVKNKLNNSKSEAKEVFSNKELKAQPKSVPPIAYVKFNKNEEKGLLEVENRSIEGGDFLERRPGKTILIEESGGTLIGGQNPFKTKKTNYQNIELSLDYLLNENLRSTIKLHKYGDEKIKFKNFGFWNSKIKEYFLDYEKVLKTWMEKDFNPHIMIHMGIILGSKYAKEVHAPIEVSFGSEMERFLDSFLRDPLKYKNAENWYIKKMPRFEGQRRILALRKQIQQYVVSKKWLAIIKRTQGYPVQTDEILGIEKQFTINLCESEILLRDDLFEDGKFHQPIPAIVKEAFGEEEALRRVKLLEFLKYRNSPHKWWRDQQDYDKLNLKNGVDFHKALKVADILQFGWYSFADSTSWGRMTIDEAFFSFMDVLIRSKNSIPWKESPERNWLISCKNEKYFEKLIIFATRASEKQNLISEKIAKDPRRLDDWEKMFNRSIKDFKKNSLGDTIIWWDLGHKPQMLIVIEERVEPILEHLKNGRKYKFQESWKLLMRNVDIRSMVIDYCTFFHRNLDESTEKQLQSIVLGEILGVKEGKITAENSQTIINELSGLVEYHKNIPLSTQILNYLYDYAYIVAKTMFR